MSAVCYKRLEQGRRPRPVSWPPSPGHSGHRARSETTCTCWPAKPSRQPIATISALTRPGLRPAGHRDHHARLHQRRPRQRPGPELPQHRTLRQVRWAARLRPQPHLALVPLTRQRTEPTSQHQDTAQAYVADLRAAAARRGPDQAAAELVSDLQQASLSRWLWRDIPTATPRWSHFKPTQGSRHHHVREGGANSGRPGGARQSRQSQPSVRIDQSIWCP